jgi:monofunctional biosynthetic peptidoglycan transglycosylase
MTLQPERTAPRSPLKRTNRTRLKTALIIALVVLLVPYALAPLYRVVNPVSTLMLWRWGRGATVERAWMPLERIAPALPRSVIVAEDDRFCSHHGVDFGEMREVVRAEVRGVRRPRGGSGITQQLAKNLFLWPGRSYVRKALEFPLALWVDLVIPKRRQIELYLNVVQWGPGGEFGAEAGARRAYGRSASSLSVPQAALMAATLPNPLRRDARQPNSGLRRLAAVIATRAASEGDSDRCIRFGRRS